MKILFVHQNFPGQFKHLAPILASTGQHDVRAFTMNNYPSTHGINIMNYKTTRGTSPNIHPWVTDFETKVIRGEAAFRAALALKKEGYTPDIIYAHPGWGESLFLKEVWPTAKLLVYCEFYYQTHGADTGFDPEFPAEDEGNVCRLRIKNINSLLYMEDADAGLSPTHWQRSTYPENFKKKIHVIHDGVDTNIIKPNDGVQIKIGDRIYTKNDQIITFVNRNLEPYRGYHVFMRALPEIQKRNPKAITLIVGGDASSYGAKPKSGGTTWKEVFLNENKDKLDMSRIFFLGNIPYKNFISMLQLSSVHVYLTYPFVLSWSLLEAMACECSIVASDTQPLLEAIDDNVNGSYVNFFDQLALTEKITELLQDREKARRLGQAARQKVIANYDLKSVCLPQQIQLLQSLK